MELIQVARSSYEDCYGLSQQEVIDFLYKHLNEEGKACVKGVQEIQQEIDQLVEAVEHMDFKKVLEFLRQIFDLATKTANHC